jgi:hypothetical protein
MWDEMVKKDVAKTERYAAGITRHAAIDLQHGAYHSQGMYIHMCAEDLLVHLRTEGYMETRLLVCLRHNWSQVCNDWKTHRPCRHQGWLIQLPFSTNYTQYPSSTAALQLKTAHISLHKGVLVWKNSLHRGPLSEGT